MTYDRNRPGGQWPPGQSRPAYGIPRNHYGDRQDDPRFPQAAYDQPGPYGQDGQDEDKKKYSPTTEVLRGINKEAFKNPDYKEPIDVRYGNLEAFPNQGSAQNGNVSLELSPWLKSRINGTMHLWNPDLARKPELFVNCDEFGNEDPDAWYGKLPAGFIGGGEGRAALQVVRTGVTPAPHPAPPSPEAYPRYAPEAYGKPAPAPPVTAPRRVPEPRPSKPIVLKLNPPNA